MIIFVLAAGLGVFVATHSPTHCHLHHCGVFDLLDLIFHH